MSADHITDHRGNIIVSIGDEVEKQLSKDMQYKYLLKHLPKVTGADLDGWMIHELPKTTCAAARQRVVALLLTVMPEVFTC